MGDLSGELHTRRVTRHLIQRSDEVKGLGACTHVAMKLCQGKGRRGAKGEAGRTNGTCLAIRPFKAKTQPDRETKVDDAHDSR